MRSDSLAENRLVTPEAPLLDLVVHPARVRPGTTLVLLVYLGLASWLLARFSATSLGLSTPACAGLVMFAFVVLLRAWFVPTRYRFDHAGVEVSGIPPRRYPWRRFRSWRKVRGGYSLSPFSNPRRFDHFRGLFLPLENCWFVASFRPQALPDHPENEAGLSGPSPRLLSLDTQVQALLKEKVDGRSVPVP